MTMPTPSGDQPTQPAQPTPPTYVDPITGAPLYVDPITGQLSYGATVGTPAPDPAASQPPFETNQMPPNPYPPPGYPALTGGYTYPIGANPYGSPGRTNGMAIASLVVSIAAYPLLACYGVGGLVGLVGAILGHVARKQVRERGDNGGGLALAGIICGWIALALGVVIVGFFVYLFTHLNDLTGQTTGY